VNREQNITHLVHIVKAAAEVHGNLGVGDSTALRIAEAVYSELERFPQFIPQEPLTLKTEDGRFVKVELTGRALLDEGAAEWSVSPLTLPGGLPSLGVPVYRVVEDPTP
jgi:hypothetical protein